MGMSSLMYQTVLFLEVTMLIPPHLPQPHTITDPFGYSPVVLPHVVPQPLEPQPVGPQSVGPHPVVPPGFRPGPVVPPVIPHGPPPAQAPGPQQVVPPVVPHGPPAAPSQFSVRLDLSKIRRKNCSRGNFAKNLFAEILPEDEWVKLNVNGKRGKDTISPHIVNYVKQSSFYIYPLESNESMEQAWGFCVRSIDAADRQLKRKK